MAYEFINIRLPEKQKAMIVAQARAEMRPLSDFVRMATVRYCLEKAGKYRVWIDPHKEYWFSAEQVNFDV